MNQHKACVFCKKEVKLTKEHVLPNWLCSLYPTDEMVINEFTGASQSQWNSKIFQHTAKVVCESCNGGWMSKLEKDIKPLLTKMLNLEPLLIQKAEQELLAFWAQKTFLMLNKAIPNGLKITQDAYDDVYNLKSSSKKILVNLGWRANFQGTKQNPIASYEIKQITSIQVKKELGKQVEEEKNNGGFVWKGVFAIGPVIFELIGHNMPIVLNVEIPKNSLKTIQPYKENLNWPNEWPAEAEGGLDKIKTRG